MSIVFYSMGSRCGYCVKAETLLKPQIQSGEIVKKPASEAGGKFNGFPAFESKKTGKTSMGCPNSYEHLAKKLGHTEGYSSGKSGDHHNPYHYNAMPIRVGSDLCSPCLENGPFDLDGGGNLVARSGMTHEQCVTARAKCPLCDQGSDPCAPAPKPKPPSGPSGADAAKKCNSNPNPNPNEGVDQCCANQCNNDPQCIADCVQIVEGHGGGGNGGGGGGGGGNGGGGGGGGGGNGGGGRGRGGGGSGSNGKDKEENKGEENKGEGKKKGISRMEIALIGTAIVGLLGLIGFLAYLAKTNRTKK